MPCLYRFYRPTRTNDLFIRLSEMNSIKTDLYSRLTGLLASMTTTRIELFIQTRPRRVCVCTFGCVRGVSLQRREHVCVWMLFGPYRDTVIAWLSPVEIVYPNGITKVSWCACMRVNEWCEFTGGCKRNLTAMRIRYIDTTCIVLTFNEQILKQFVFILTSNNINRLEISFVYLLVAWFRTLWKPIKTVVILILEYLF